MLKGTPFWPTLLLGTGLLAASTAGFAATMYKWIDSEGNVQYTQTPPPKGSFETMAPPPAPATPAPESSTPQTAEPASSKEDDEAAKQDDERKRLEASVAKHNCETARKNLEIYTAFRRVKGDKGEIITLGDDERAAKIKQANEMIEKYCR